MKARLLAFTAISLMFIMCLSGCSIDKSGVSDDLHSRTTTAQPDASESTEEVTHNVFGVFETQTLDGKRVNEDVFEDKITMVNIWATFCGPCIKEMPYIEQISKEYADKNLQVVGIVSDVYLYSDGSYDSALLGEAKDVVSYTGVTYLNLLPSESLEKAKLNDIRYVPETIFLDENGNQIGESYVGAHSYDEWIQIIESVLSTVK